MADEPAPDQRQERDTQPVPAPALGKGWFTALKIFGPGSGMALLASGAALNSLPAHAYHFLPLKIAAGIFLVGVLAYGIAIWFIDVSLTAFDNYLRALDEEASSTDGTIAPDAKAHLESSNKIMALAKGLAVVVFAAFFLGSVAALVTLVAR